MGSDKKDQAGLTKKGKRTEWRIVRYENMEPLREEKESKKSKPEKSEG